MGGQAAGYAAADAAQVGLNFWAIINVCFPGIQTECGDHVELMMPIKYQALPLLSTFWGILLLMFIAVGVLMPSARRRKD